MQLQLQGERQQSNIMVVIMHVLSIHKKNAVNCSTREWKQYKTYPRSHCNRRGFAPSFPLQCRFHHLFLKRSTKALLRCHFNISSSLHVHLMIPQVFSSLWIYTRKLSALTLAAWHCPNFKSLDILCLLLLYSKSVLIQHSWGTGFAA